MLGRLILFFNIFWQTSTTYARYTRKTNFTIFQTVDPEICLILIWVQDQLLQHILCIILQGKYFSCYILSTDLVLSDSIWLALLLETLSNMCVVLICYPVCDAINFEIYNSFFINPFFNLIKKSRRKCKYLKKEKSFQHEIRSIFHHF